MLTFSIICVLMIVFVLWFVLPPLLRVDSNGKADGGRAANLLVYRDQLRELEADVKDGLLTESQFQQDKEELERRLLQDVTAGQSQSVSRPLVTRKLAYTLAFAIPAAAILLYFAIGNPKALQTQPANNPSIAPQMR